MAFWTDINTREPLRQYRWYMSFNFNIDSLFASTFGDLNLDANNINDLKIALKDCTKPTVKIDTTSHVLLNHTFNYPKSAVWDPVQVTLVSAQGDIASDNTTANTIYKILRASGYYDSLDKNLPNQISKQSALFSSIKIIQIDEGYNDALKTIKDGANEIEIWHLINPFISNISFGSLSYENENFVDIKLTITYDYAKLEVPVIDSKLEDAKYDLKQKSLLDLLSGALRNISG